MESRVAQAYKLAKAGEKIKAQNLLVSVVKDDDRNEDAWLLLGFLIESKQKKLQCLQKVIEINPENEKAQKALSRLKEANPLKTKSPPSLSHNVNVQQKSNIPEPAAQTAISENPSKVAAPLSDQQLIEQYVSKMNDQGWTVVSLTSSSVQLKKPKTWDTGLIILGVLLGFLGIGFILIAIAVVDYLSKSDETKFVTATELRQSFLIEDQQIEDQNLKESPQKSIKKGKTFLNDPLFWVVVVMVLLFLCTLSSMLN